MAVAGDMAECNSALRLPDNAARGDQYKMFGLAALTGLVLSLSINAANGQAAAGKEFPAFKEVYDLIHSNLPEMTEAELNQAAVLGLLDRLATKVVLVTNAPAASGPSRLSKTAVFDDAFGYLRVAQVGPGLAKEIKAASDELNSKRKLSGLIVDLRFAGGHDYAAAAEAADLFFSTEQALLKWSDVTKHSTVKPDAIRLPISILVNKQTAGAAEALGAALRQAEVGLVIGSPTSGLARVFKDFTLSNGQVMKIALSAIETGDGKLISGTGVIPDIRIVLSPDDEKAYFDDPYKALPRLFAQSVRPNATNELSGVFGTNRPPRRRLNESELIRMQRDGIDIDREPPAGSHEQPAKPVVNDPALARGIDFLKGVSLVQNRR
jgi:hypothetical protein